MPAGGRQGRRLPFSFRFRLLGTDAVQSPVGAGSPSAPPQRQPVAVVRDARRHTQAEVRPFDGKAVPVAGHIGRLAQDESPPFPLPVHRDHPVAPAEACVIFLAVFLIVHPVVAAVKVQPQGVVCIGAVQPRDVGITERISDGGLLHLQPPPVEQVDVGPAARQDEFGLPSEGQVERSLRRNQADGQLAFHPSCQRVRPLHIDETAETVGCRGGEGRTGELQAGIMGGIEDGEDAQYVLDVIQLDTVDADPVVRIVAALDIQAGIQFGIGLHARQQLRVAYRVGIAGYARHIVEERQVQAHASEAVVPQLPRHVPADDLHALQLLHPCRVGFLCMGRQREEQGAEQGKQQSAGFRTDGKGVHRVVGRWIHTDGEVTSEGTDRSWKSSLTDFQDLPSPHGQVSLPALRRWYQKLKRRLKALIISPASLKIPAKFFRLK